MYSVFFVLLSLFLFSFSDYWGAKRGFCPHPNYLGGACPGCPQSLRLCLASDFPNIVSLAEEADRRLFKSIIQRQTPNVRRHLFIDKPTSTRSLRVRAHNFILSPKDNRNFVSRVLSEALCPLRTARSSL